MLLNSRGKRHRPVRRALFCLPLIEIRHLDSTSFTGCCTTSPRTSASSPEATPKQDNLPDGSRQGRNGFDNVGYGGPCPPGNSTHRYVFDLYALDTRLNLPAGATKKDVVKAMEGHVLASGELIGRYQR